MAWILASESTAVPTLRPTSSLSRYAPRSSSTVSLWKSKLTSARTGARSYCTPAMGATPCILSPLSGTAALAWGASDEDGGSRMPPEYTCWLGSSWWMNPTSSTTVSWLAVIDNILTIPHGLEIGAFDFPFTIQQILPQNTPIYNKLTYDV